jgi:transcriptional regulator with XRE-family HTH domain
LKVNTPIYLPEFADKLKRARKDKGITQIQLARMIGKDRHSVGNWETDLSFPNAQKLKRICEILDISADYLLGLTNEKN